MDDAGDTLIQRRKPPHIAPLSQADLAMINRVREELVFLSIKPPSWRDTDPAKRRRFFDEVRAVLMDLGGSTANINRDAQIVTDALSGVGLLDQLLRDPFVEEIFVRKGEVAVEYDGAFHYLGKLADDRYFEDLAIHVADQGGATLRGDRPAVLIDLPGGERFTAIVPRLSTEGTAINIRTFGRRVKTLEEMERTGTFTKRGVSLEGSLCDIADAEICARIVELKNTPDRFLAWVAATLSGSILVAGEMGSGKTTLLNALSGFLPRQAPLAALETFRELEIQHPFLLRAVAPAELPEGTKRRDPGLGAGHYLHPHESRLPSWWGSGWPGGLAIPQSHLSGPQSADDDPRRHRRRSLNAPGAAGAGDRAGIRSAGDPLDDRHGPGCGRLDGTRSAQRPRGAHAASHRAHPRH